MIIAIDGPAGSGKGTLAKQIAAHYGLAHLDTGKLYRGVALALQRAGGVPDTEDAFAAAAEQAALGLDMTGLDDPALKHEDIGALASRVAAIPGVRTALRAKQQDFARNPPGNAAGAVLDGRDIGTVVCPDADIKIYVTADLAARANRRFAELTQSGQQVSLSDIRAQMAERDDRDQNRADSPLRPAADAHLLDSTKLDIKAAFAAARRIIDRHLPR